MLTIKVNREIGARVADIGANGREYNVKVDDAWRANEELMIKAGNMAKGFFYADSAGTLWPDFEGHSEAWINRQIEELEQTIYQSFKGK